MSTEAKKKEDDKIGPGTDEYFINKYGQGTIITERCPGCNRETFRPSAGVFVNPSGSIKIYADDEEFRCPDAKCPYSSGFSRRGKRSDLGGLEEDWKKVEEWQKKRAPFQSKTSKPKQKITCEPVLAAVKLAAYNAFQETNDLFLPSNKTIFITDNTKKKMISKVQNDTQLAKITCIGYVCQVKEESESGSSDGNDSCSEINHHSECKCYSECKSQRSHHSFSMSVQNAEKTEDSRIHDKPSIDLSSKKHKGNTPQSSLSDQEVAASFALPEDGSIHFPPSKQGKQYGKVNSTSFLDMACYRSQPVYKQPNTLRCTPGHVPQDEEVSFKKQDLSTVQIKEEDLKYKEVVGKGAFGKVHSGMWQGMQVAIKEMQRGYGTPDMSEIEVCRRLKHPNVILMIGYVLTDTDILIVTNLVRGVNLAVAIGLMPSKKKFTLLDPKFNGYVMFKIGQGMIYLHQKGIIHQDLKPANILIEERSNNPVVCDFGVSKIKDDCITVASVQVNGGTLAYQHLESLDGQKPTFAVDVYSFGVVMGEVYSRKRAWSNFKAPDVRNAIMNGKFPHFDIDVDGADEVIKSCLQIAAQRPSFAELAKKLELLCEPDMIW